MKKITMTLKVVVSPPFAPMFLQNFLCIFFEFLLSIGSCSFYLVYRNTRCSSDAMAHMVYHILGQPLFGYGTVKSCEHIHTHVVGEACKMKLSFVVSSSSRLCKTLWNIYTIKALILSNAAILNIQQHALLYGTMPFCMGLCMILPLRLSAGLTVETASLGLPSASHISYFSILFSLGWQ